ncbi:MAG TPA: HAMP domain-containing sensor histidine kinase [Gemmatimonadales bacterium]
MRRWSPEITLALLAVFGGVSVWQAWDVANHLRSEARSTSHVYSQIIAALNDPRPGADAEALLALSGEIRETGIAIVVTDSLGRVTATQNLPFTAQPGDQRLTAFVAAMDRDNPPIPASGKGGIHFGALPVTSRLAWVGLLQIATLLMGTLAAFWAYRAAVNRDRDRLWVAMARESAHQLGTPLMSAAGWVERLEGAGDAAKSIGVHLTADLERLGRVAQRFERIGRPARRERVALGALAARIAGYFEPRLPRVANLVALVVEAPAAGPFVEGDVVLLEWALEALVRNALDALSGKGGTIRISVTGDEHAARLTVADDGPGVAIEVRGRLFEPGVTTKQGGWGIGLALARRIVEDVHGGRLTLQGGSPGAVFVAVIPGAPV